MFHFARSSFSTYEFSKESSRFRGTGFPHSETPGSKVAWDLTEDYRTLQRPSSSNDVEASTVRPFAHSQKHKIVLSQLFCTLHDFFLVNCQERTGSSVIGFILSHKVHRFSVHFVKKNLIKKTASEAVQTFAKKAVLTRLDAHGM